MTAIGSITPEPQAVPLPDSVAKPRDTPTTRGADQAAARAAHLAEKKAADQLAADQAAKAAAGVIKIDQQALTKNTNAAKSADAAVKADQQGSGLLNIVT
jgi:hypothetical protein